MTMANPVTLPLSGYTAQHVRLAVEGTVATITLNRPEIGRASCRERVFRAV